MNRVLYPLIICLLLAGCRGNETAAPGVDPLFGPTTVPPPPTGAAAMVDPYYANPTAVGRRPASGDVPTTPLADGEEPRTDRLATADTPSKHGVETVAAETASGTVRTATYEEPIPARQGDVIRIPAAALEPSPDSSPPEKPSEEAPAAATPSTRQNASSQAASSATEDGWRPNADAALRPMESAMASSPAPSSSATAPRGPIVRTLYPARQNASSTAATKATSTAASEPQIVDITSLPPAPAR
ncbi:hypothetical protein JCM19992_27400 [Thermostilla marina]